MKQHRSRRQLDPDITYRKLGEGEYAATKFGVTITMRKHWDKMQTGYWWECSETGTCSSTRDYCARVAFMKLNEMPS